MINVINIPKIYTYPLCGQVSKLIPFTPREIRKTTNGVFFVLHIDDIVIGAAKIVNNEITNFAIDKDHQTYNSLLLLTILDQIPILSVVVSREKNKFISFLLNYGFIIAKRTNKSIYLVSSKYLIPVGGFHPT
jgi:hypothetical protein